ncbi:MAG: hypothetical protein ABH971_02955 [bacterium]
MIIENLNHQAGFINVIFEEKIIGKIGFCLQPLDAGSHKGEKINKIITEYLLDSLIVSEENNEVRESLSELTEKLKEELAKIFFEENPQLNLFPIQDLNCFSYVYVKRTTRELKFKSGVCFAKTMKIFLLSSSPFLNYFLLLEEMTEKERLKKKIERLVEILVTLLSPTEKIKIKERGLENTIEICLGLAKKYKTSSFLQEVLGRVGEKIEISKKGRRAFFLSLLLELQNRKFCKEDLNLIDFLDPSPSFNFLNSPEIKTKKIKKEKEGVEIFVLKFIC